MSLLYCDRFGGACSDNERADMCSETAVYVLVTAYSLGKAPIAGCRAFKPARKEPKICDFVYRYRGQALCDKIGIKDPSQKKDCMEYFPASEKDCQYADANHRGECYENYKLYTAIKGDNPSLCPAGRLKMPCMAFLIKDKNKACNDTLQKLSSVYCGGGSFKNGRKLHRPGNAGMKPAPRPGHSDDDGGSKGE